MATRTVRISTMVNVKIETEMVIDTSCTMQEIEEQAKGEIMEHLESMEITSEEVAIIGDIVIKSSFRK